MNETLSDYENEQIQRILQKDIDDKKISERRDEMTFQNLEYEKALAQDIAKEEEGKNQKNQENQTVDSDRSTVDDFDEPTLEEVRRVRLLRFNNKAHTKS